MIDTYDLHEVDEEVPWHASEIADSYMYPVVMIMHLIVTMLLFPYMSMSTRTSKSHRS
jgi:hypothetical protein